MIRVQRRFRMKFGREPKKSPANDVIFLRRLMRF
jgi:hypothetical protein